MNSCRSLPKFKYSIFQNIKISYPGLSGIGCAIRDHYWIFKGRLVIPLLSNTNNVVEFKALLLSSIECSKRGIKNIKIKGDSAILINTIRAGRTPN